MDNKQFLSTSETAKMLGISRVAVFNKIKNGTIKAAKIGNSYAIDRNEIEGTANKTLSKSQEREIDEAVEKVIDEYGETLRLLGKE